VDSSPKKYSKTLVQKNAIAEHRSFSLQNAFSIAIFSHSFKFCKCWAIDALSCPPASGSLRQRLAAFGALHFTSFLFTIAVF